MKAKVISTGEIVEVKAWKGQSDVFFTTTDMNHFYQQSEIELIPLEEPIIMVSQLNDILKQALDERFISEYGAHRIIGLVKKEFDKGKNFI